MTVFSFLSLSSFLPQYFPILNLLSLQAKAHFCDLTEETTVKGNKASLLCSSNESNA